MRPRSFTAGILWAVLTATSARGEAPSVLDLLAPADLDLVKRGVEAKLAERSGHPVLCEDASRACIASYEKLLAFDWSKSTLDPGKKIVVSTQRVSSDRGAYYVVNPGEGGPRMRRFLGADPSAAAKTAADLPHALEALDLWKGRSCPGVSPAEVAPAPCPGREKYYDEVFKSGTFETTIVRGYLDAHEETVSGVLAEQYLHTKKVPVSLQADRDEVTANLDELTSEGFHLDSSGPNDWTLSRTFYYKGQPKTARVHLVSATALCPGEKPDENGTVLRRDDELCPEQREVTLAARKAFVDAFGRSQLVVYNGHSRLGRGPDFGPLGRDEGKFSIAKGALDPVDLKGVPSTLVLASCQSLRYFERGVQRKQKALGDPDRLAFLGTSADATWDGGADIARLIRAVMEARCPADLPDVMNVPRSADFGFQYRYGRRPATPAPGSLLGSKVRSGPCDVTKDHVPDARSRRLCSFGHTYVQDESGRNVCVSFNQNGEIGDAIDPSECDRQDEAGDLQMPVQTGAPSLDLHIGPRLPVR